MKLLINNVDYTKNILTPIKAQEVLDESLDQGVLTLTNMDSEIPFEPLTKLYLDDQIWLVGKDNVSQTRFGKESKYRHEIGLIEETKLLERYFVEANKTTNKIIEGESRLNYAKPVIVDETAEQIFNSKVLAYGIDSEYLCSLSGLYTFKKFSDIFTLFDIELTGYMSVEKDGREIYNTGMMNVLELTEYQTELEDGDYVVFYVMFTTQNEKVLVSYNITGLPIIELSKKTLADVVDKILIMAEIPRKGSGAIFSLNEEQRSELSLIETPEFSISTGTLREALNKVGDYIHAEVRLRNNVIYFDKYGTKEKANIKKQHVAYMSVQDVEQFCSEIDGNVSNLIIDKDNDVREGTIEPYYNGYITPRTETGIVELTENNCFIPTRHNIQDIIKVEVGFANFKYAGVEVSQKVGDITDYVVEKSIYDTMSSYSDENKDESKAYHIYWEKDKKGIKGLDFELKTVLGGSFQYYAISNIINKILGLDTLADYFNFEGSVIKLQFRITYVPIINIRLKQHKPYLFSTNQKSVLSYSQNDYKIDHKYYGENMKGAVARLGNIEKTLTYIYRNDEELPKVGTLFDKNYYISAVLQEKYHKISKVSIVLSKDFNRINEYIGINNEKRFYEIPLQNVVERQIVYEDYLIVGDYVNLEKEKNQRTLASSGLFYGLLSKFNNDGGGFDGIFLFPVSNVLIKNHNIDGWVASMRLPVVCFPFGNSAVFNFSFQDNYGAGDYISEFKTDTKALQDQLRYTDNYGEVEYLSFSMYGITDVRTDESDNIIEFLEPANFDEAVKIGSELPKGTSFSGINVGKAPAFVSTEDVFPFFPVDFPLHIKKDAGESISITYQIHCVTNKENIVIGSGLAKMLNVEQYKDGDKYYEVKCYILDNEVRNLENTIDELPESVSYGLVETIDAKTLKFPNITANRNGKCIAFVNADTKELIYAINMEVEQGKEYELPNISIRHKIRD